MKRLARDQAKKLQDDARLAKAWRQWHAEELAEARNGPHGAIVTELMDVLDRLTPSSAPALLACFERPDWTAVNYDVRLTILHQLNTAITRLQPACANSMVRRLLMMACQVNVTTVSGASKI